MGCPPDGLVMDVLTRLGKAAALLAAVALLAAPAAAQQIGNNEPMALPPAQDVRLIAPAGGLLGFQRGRADETVPLSTLTHIRGLRVNHLIGHGLVVGLQNTGDTQQSQFSIQLLVNAFKHSGITLPSSINPTNIQVRDVAAVMVTCDMPPFARKGSRLDLLVSAIGDARSLQGGTLLMTPLYGADGRAYALAQGPITIEGYFAGAQGGASSRKNFQTAGQIPDGATVEREVPNGFANWRTIDVELNDPSATLAMRAAQALAMRFPKLGITVADPGMLEVKLAPWMNPVAFTAALSSVKVRPPESDRVVIDERTGTVVVGGMVTVGAAAVSHGNLTVTIQPQLQVSQPNPLSLGRTVVNRTAKIKVHQDKGEFFVTPEAANVQQIAETLNAVGAKPGDAIAIFEGLRAAGALHGQLLIR